MIKSINPEHFAIFLRCKSNPDLYYLCRKIQQSSIALPGEITMETINPILVSIGLSNGGFVKIDHQSPIWDEIEDEIAESDSEPVTLPVAPQYLGERTFVGTVSFRAECANDVEALFSLLKDEFTGAWDQCLNQPADLEPDVEVELLIRMPLTISELYRVMKKIDDGYVMVETLRALPLAKNSLIRRDEPSAFDEYLPIDFAEDAPLA